MVEEVECAVLVCGARFVGLAVGSEGVDMEVVEG